MLVILIVGGGAEPAADTSLSSQGHGRGRPPTLFRLRSNGLYPDDHGGLSSAADEGGLVAYIFASTIYDATIFESSPYTGPWSFDQVGNHGKGASTLTFDVRSRDPVTNATVSTRQIVLSRDGWNALKVLIEDEKELL